MDLRPIDMRATFHILNFPSCYDDNDDHDDDNA